MNWIILLFLAICLLGACFVGTQLSIFLALRLGIVDDPKSAPERKNQAKPIPLMGSLGFVLTSMAAMGLVWMEVKFNWLGQSGYLQNGLFFPFRLMWILVGGGVIYFAGILDDKFQLSAKYYFLIILSGLLITVFAGGLKIEAFSAPFDRFDLTIGILPQILAIAWIGACLTATKFLDGHDGLVTTMGIISFLTIASVSTFISVNQPLILIFSLIWTIGLLSFLPFNFPSAKVYLGDGGSTLIGFFIGVLAILSGAKVATAATVIGWFILDITLVMIFRVIKGKSFNSILKADSNLHWHHRLKKLGLNKIQVLAVTAIILLTSSQVGLINDSTNKFWLLVGQITLLTSAFTISNLPQKLTTGKNSTRLS